MISQKLTIKDEILETVLPLFAGKGFEGVSMRQIAKVVGMQPASLYHHFSDKKSLYLESIERAFANSTSRVLAGLEIDGTIEKKLEGVIRDMVRDRRDNPVYYRIISRELLDGDEERLRQIATQVFAVPFQKLTSFFTPIAKEQKPDRLVLSLVAMIDHHFDTESIRQFLPGYNPAHDEEEAFVAHIMCFFRPLLDK